MEKTRSETISQLAVQRVAAWSVKRASWPTADEQAAEAMSPIGSGPAHVSADPGTVQSQLPLPSRTVTILT